MPLGVAIVTQLKWLVFHKWQLRDKSNEKYKELHLRTKVREIGKSRVHNSEKGRYIYIYKINHAYNIAQGISFKLSL